MAEKAKSDNKKNDKEQYRQARDEFDTLKIEEKAIFLVESTFSMLAHGIQAVGDVFSEQVNKVYQEKEEGQKTKTPPKTRKTTRKRSTSTRTRKTNPKAEE